MLAEFVKDLESTADQVQELLIEIRDNKIDFATVRAELTFVVENVKQLSSIIRDGDQRGSVLTRLALVENTLNELKSEFKEYLSKDTASNTELEKKVALLEQRVSSMSDYIESLKTDEEEQDQHEKQERAADRKWKLYATIAGGVFTVVGSIIALIMSIWGN